MAILENLNYIKILPDHCYVDDLVHVSFEQYYSQEDRIKEQKRSELISTFINTIESDLNKMCDIEDADLDYIDQIFLAVYNIKYASVQYNKINPYIYEIEDENILNYLLKNGLNTDWYNDPIFKFPLRTVSCGEYNGEEINTEFYYKRLKNVMNQEIIKDI